MKRWLVGLAALLCLSLIAGPVRAEPVNMVVDGRSLSVDGFTASDRLWVALIGFCQAVGGGTRPVRVDQTQALVTITSGDGSRTATVSFVLRGNTIYIAALEALSGLGLTGTVTGAAPNLTLSVSAAPRPSPAPPVIAAAATRFAPDGLASADVERAAREFYDAVGTTADPAPMLGAVLEGFQIPVYGAARPADPDVIGLRLYAHRPFALSLEFPALAGAFERGAYVSLRSFLRSEAEGGVKTKAGAAFDVPGFNAALSGFLGLARFSRSQALIAFVGALGRERVRRGLRSQENANLDPFWGETTLDPMQLRLLSALFEAGPPSPRLRFSAARPAPAARPRTVALRRLGGDLLNPFARSLERAALPSPTRSRITAQTQQDAPKPLRWFFEKVADKAVDQIKDEVNPQIDDAIQEYLGIPFPIPEGTDPESLRAGIKQALKENTTAAFCASVILYGYEIKLERSQSVVHHRTPNNQAGPYSSTFTVHVRFMDDYRSKVFGTRLTGPIGTAAQLLEKIGCAVPPPGDAAGKPVEWIMPASLEPHALDGEFKLPELNTSDAGQARAKFEAVFERIPKALRVAEQSVEGNIGVNVSGLLPKKWSTIEAGVRGGNKTGIADRLLNVKFFDAPKLAVDFQSTLDTTGSDGARLHLQLESQFALQAKFSGSGDSARLTSMGGAGDLRYLSRSITGESKQCTAKIVDTIKGRMEVNLSAEDDTSDALNLLLNPGFPPGGAMPQEVYEAVGAQCNRTGTSPGWFGQFVGIHSAERGQLIGGSAPLIGLVLSGQRQADTVLFEKTYDRTVPTSTGSVKENTVIRIKVLAGQ
jgi:hypothetical protein